MCSRGNGILTREEGFARKVDEHATILADGVKQHRFAELRGGLAQDMNGLRLEIAQVRQGWLSHDSSRSVSKYTYPYQ